MSGDESCMILQEEQLCDWTDMASAFSEGMRRTVYIRLYIYNHQQFQRTQFLQLEDFQSRWIKNCVCIKSIFASRHKVQFLVKLVVSGAVLHTGRLLHVLLWAHSKASVLLICKNIQAGKPSRADWFTMFYSKSQIAKSFITQAYNWKRSIKV